jgi:superfamily II DNA or RNA helicase
MIVDEFHHASARTYRRLIDYFEPEFLLGLTATPERTDGGDLLTLCGENHVFRCDLVQGIEEDLLSPVQSLAVFLPFMPRSA